MTNIDDIRPDFINLIANHFSGRYNITLPRQHSESIKLIKSKLYANVIPIEINLRYIEYKIIVDKFESTFIFYTSLNKSIVWMHNEFTNKINNIAIKLFIDNGEEDRLDEFRYNILDNLNHIK